MRLEQPYHVSVMLHETVDALQIKSNGIYVDATFGGGGHSRYLLSKLGEKGKLFVFDQDVDAKANVPAGDDRMVFINENFKNLQRWLQWYNVTEVDGIMADLGVSSHQFDEASRGFSIRFNGPLDMRMDKRVATTAYDVLKTYDANALQLMFQNYGEVTNAKTLAQRIVSMQHSNITNTIDAFKNSIADLVKGNPNRYFAQVFQALRIEVNKEMDAIKALIQQAATCLCVGGRLSVITFHSIEDRVVKNGIKDGYEDASKHNPLLPTPKTWCLKAVNKKPIEPTNEEIKNNSRSRSAKLRVAEKIKL
jgi:16S rRNA (cytosine1402-N4)-methyltransferase